MPSGLPPPDDSLPLDESGELQLTPELQRLADALRGDAARMGEQVVPQAAMGQLLTELAARPGGNSSSRSGRSPSARSTATPLESQRSLAFRATWGQVLAALLFLGLAGGVASRYVSWAPASGTVAHGDSARRFEPTGEKNGYSPAVVPDQRAPIDGLPAGSVSTAESPQAESPQAESPQAESFHAESTQHGAATDGTNRSEAVRDGENGNPLSPEAISLGLLAERRGPRTGLEESPDAWLGDARRLDGELLMSSEEKMRLLEQALDRYRSVIEFQQERIRSDQEELRAARAEIERLEQALRESGYRAREHPSVVAEPELDVSRGKLESRAGGLAPD